MSRDGEGISLGALETVLGELGATECRIRTNGAGSAWSASVVLRGAATVTRDAGSLGAALSRAIDDAGASLRGAR